MPHSAENENPEETAMAGARVFMQADGAQSPREYGADSWADEGDDRLVGDDDIEYDADGADDGYADGFDEDENDDGDDDGDYADYADDEDDEDGDDEDDDEDEDGVEPILSLIRSHLGDDGRLPRGFSLISFAPGYEDIKDDLTDLAKFRSEYIDDDNADDDDTDLIPVQYTDGFTDGMEIYSTGLNDPTERQVAAIRDLMYAIKRSDIETAGYLLDDLADSLPAIEAEDAMLEAIEDEADDEVFLENLLRMGVTLVIRGTDPYTVKYGIVMLEGFDLPEPVKEVLRTLGRCDEFTLFVVAAMHRWTHANDEIFELARHVEGWGRIHCVDALQPQDDEQRMWLLHEGWRNTVVAAYSVVPCFEKSGAAQLLADGNLTDDEFADIADMLTVLIDEDGVVSAGISAFDDADRIVEDFLEVAARRSQEVGLTDAEQEAVDYAEQYQEDAQSDEYGDWADDDGSDFDDEGDEDDAADDGGGVNR